MSLIKPFSEYPEMFNKEMSSECPIRWDFDLVLIPEYTKIQEPVTIPLEVDLMSFPVDESIKMRIYSFREKMKVRQSSHLN